MRTAKAINASVSLRKKTFRRTFSRKISAERYDPKVVILPVLHFFCQLASLPRVVCALPTCDPTQLLGAIMPAEKLHLQVRAEGLITTRQGMGLMVALPVVTQHSHAKVLCGSFWHPILPGCFDAPFPVSAFLCLFYKKKCSGCGTCVCARIGLLLPP